MAIAVSTTFSARRTDLLNRMAVGAFSALLMMVSVAETAHAQTRIRRLGERIREGVQQRLPISPLAPAPTANPAAAESANRAAGLRRPGSVNQPTPAAAPNAASQSPVARSNYNSPTNTASPNRTIARATDSTQNRAIADSGQSVLSAANSSAGSKARLGVTVETPPVSSAGRRSSRPSRGAMVVGVGERSGAEAAGLQVGDLIVAVDGRVVENVPDFVSRLVGKQPGDQVDIRFVRNKQLDAATAIMAGPDGRLDDETYARQFGLLEPNAGSAGETSADEARQPNNATAGAIGGLGRIIGGLMGDQRTQGKPFVLKQEGDKGNTLADEASESEELPPPANPDDFQPLIVEEAKAKANSERVKTDYDTLETPAEAVTGEEESLPPPRQ